MSYLKFPAALVGALLLAACASRGGPIPGEVEMLAQGNPIDEAVGRAEYRVGPSDLLEVKVFQVEDLDREVRVDNAGEISLPLIGTVVAAGKTIPELESELADRYGVRYLQDPQVSVFVKEFESQQVTVSGEVDTPGKYPISSQLTLVQALALAEGFTEYANEENVFVFRTVDGARQFARFDVEAIQAGEMADPVLQSNDVVIVARSGGKSAFINFVKLTPLFAVWARY